MNGIAIKISNLSKQYRLGEIGTGTISHDLNRWWAKIRGKEDPYLRIGEKNIRSQKSNKQYVWALRDLNLDIREGEVLGIIGKNGAGKSTLLKLLSKVTGPTEGTIKANGRIASLLEVGTGFHPELTGRENIFLNGAILGMTKKEVKFKLDEIVDFAGVARYLDTPVKRYSSGMKVRLGFAVAAHLEPEILIVDEVLAVGDAEFQKKAVGKMKQVSEAGRRTVLFVSHNMTSIQNLCTRCIVLEDGNIGFDGNSLDAISFYLNNSKKSSLPIGKRKDRRGIGLLKFEEVWINGVSSEKTDFFLEPKGKIDIAFRLKKIERVDIKAINIVFSIHHTHNGIVSTFSSLLDGIEIQDNEIIESNCIVPSLDLLPGEYFINIYCGGNGERQDAVHNVFRLIVGNQNETSMISSYQSLKHGPVLFNREWRK